MIDHHSPVERRLPGRRSRGALGLACIVGVLCGVLGHGTSVACVGTNCMEIWSTDAGGGALTVYWDFVLKKDIQTFKSFCAGGQCLYSTIDPGFITTSDPPPDGYHPLADGTDVTIEIIAIDAAATLRVNGTPLTKFGDSALLGSAPTLHNHPSWQLSLSAGTEGDYPLSYKLTTDSSQLPAGEGDRTAARSGQPHAADRRAARRRRGAAHARLDRGRRPPLSEAALTGATTRAAPPPVGGSGAPHATPAVSRAPSAMRRFRPAG